jgi:hypothetical protein
MATRAGAHDYLACFDGVEITLCDLRPERVEAAAKQLGGPGTRPFVRWFENEWKVM